MLRETLFVFAAILALAVATKVNHCGTGVPYQDTNVVRVTNCDDPPCKLRRKTDVEIEQRFVPKRDIQSLTNSIHATIFGIPLPFLGVDGTDACKNIFNADGTKAGCPLKQGQEYVYRNKFPVLELYPKVALTVYWALTERNDIVTCFEVPSRIL